jgi:hypothetical protein
MQSWFDFIHLLDCLDKDNKLRFVSESHSLGVRTTSPVVSHASHHDEFSS